VKIAIVAPSEIPARRANTLQVMKMAQAYAKLGHDAHLIIPKASSLLAAQDSATPDWAHLALHYGLSEIFPATWLPAHPKLRRYDFSLSAVRWAQRWQADLLYTRLPQAAALASRSGMGTILELHDLPQGRFGPWMLRQFLAGAGARRLVIITHALAQAIERQTAIPERLQSSAAIFSGAFSVIAPDGVDLERFQDLPTPSAARQQLYQSLLTRGIHLQPERFTAGYTGHLYPGRGVENLLALAEKLPEINFLIVGGEPNDIERLQSRVAALQLRNLFLVGFVPNAKLPLYQAACEVLLMPYQPQVAASSGGDIARYLSPMKLFEYLACGRGILSSNLPVLQEILNEDNAILLPPGDLLAWVQAINRLQSDPELLAQLANRARQDAARFTWEKRAARILEGLE
jgi:glycosyltransferase involved in cell wall biosynthesis